MSPIGRAVPCSCPGCGVGEASGLCTLTRAADAPAAGSFEPVETLFCDCCGLWVRNGVLQAHGVDLDPDDVRAAARLHAPTARPDELYVEPEARPVRLVPTEVGADSAAAPAWPEISSITLHLARPRRPSTGR